MMKKAIRQPLANSSIWLSQKLTAIGKLTAAKLQKCTERWTPATWKIALMVFCAVFGTCCLMAAFSIL